MKQKICGYGPFSEKQGDAYVHSPHVLVYRARRIKTK